MSTSAGIYFKCSDKEFERIKRFLSDIDAITNSGDGGFGYACTPMIGTLNKKERYISAQTHWDYSGEENGQPFVYELKRFLKKHKAKIEIKEEFFF